MWSFAPVLGAKLHWQGKQPIFIRWMAKFRMIVRRQEYAG